VRLTLNETIAQALLPYAAIPPRLEDEVQESNSRGLPVQFRAGNVSA